MERLSFTTAPALAVALPARAPGSVAATEPSAGASRARMVAWRAEDLPYRSQFDDPPGFQHRHPSGRVRLHPIRPTATQGFIESHQVLLFGEVQADQVDLG